MSPAPAALCTPKDRAALLIPGVNGDDRLYPIEKLQAHREGVLHLAVSVFVMCGDELLIQQRAAEKYHSAGLWANTCCSHPEWGEHPANAAGRRLREELGLRTPLRPGGVIEYAADVSNGLREHERVYVFRGEVADRDVELRLDPGEVSAVRWARVESLKQEAASNPETLAPWFRIYLERWEELGL